MLPFRPILEALEDRCLLSAYVVTSAADDGSAGTLRYGINQANMTGSTITEIDFNIGTVGSAQTISLTSQLPALTANGVLINGLSQGGTGNTTKLITLDGTNAGSTSDGLLLQGSGNVVSGLIIEHFNNGIEVAGSTNTIGGTTTGAGNVISGNSADGVLIDYGVSSVAVQGNYIGTDVTGANALSNRVGVEVYGNRNSIGGTASGAGNLISGNFIPDSSAYGVQLNGSSNQVLGNSIGTNVAGNAALPNDVGVDVEGGNDNNTIGGTASGARNLISGNNSDGLLISGDSTLILGNFIGTNATGDATLPNAGNGIFINSSHNTIGGTSSGTGNLISGNHYAGLLLGTGNNLVLGNSIGTNIAGNAALPNGTGVFIGVSSNNTVGGTAAGAGNLISGNSGDGVHISGGNNNLVLGNSIGTNITGNAALPNADRGIFIGDGNNTIGGTASGAGNLISGNGGIGVFIGNDASGNLVLGNFIGTNAAGNAALANQGGGIALFGGNANTIGGTASGARNLISGNSGDGVFINGVSGVAVQGNYIGTDVTGAKAVANSVGVELGGSANTIGGTAPGAGNIISGNTTDGVLIDSGSSDNQVVGNSIGTNVAGNAAIPNSIGIFVMGTSNTIGGTTAAARNLISGNLGDGVLLEGDAAVNDFQGNYIGTDVTGTKALANSIGVDIEATDITFGSTAPGASNIISGNSAVGVLIGATGVTVQGNYIGLNGNGSAALGNSIGIEVLGSTIPNQVAGGNDTIGGTTSNAFNVISGNSADGVLIENGATGVVVQGNSIGTNATGAAFGNGGYGVNISSSKNTIGGSVASAGNSIAYNSSGGVLVSTGSGNTIRLNSIFANGSTNTGPGITLSNGGNNNLAAPSLASAIINGTTLTVQGSFTAPTANVSYVLDFFANPTGDAEGKIYLGSLTVTPPSTGTQSFTFATTTTVTGTNPLITATVTDASADTSSFSNGVMAEPYLPPHPPLLHPLHVPPLLAFINSFFGGGIETINSDGTATLTDYFFGIPLLVETFNSSGQLTNVSLLGIDITFVFVLFGSL